MNDDFNTFLKNFEERIIPLSREAHIAYFTAMISGKDEDYTKAADLELKRSMLFADKDEFLKLKRFKDSASVTDPLLKRQLHVLYRQFLSRQIDERKLEEMVRLHTATEQLFSTFRAEINGRRMTDNEIDAILKTSTNRDELEAVWKASKVVGRVVREPVLSLIRLRNETAIELGFPNYHAMQLELDEQDPHDVDLLFDELDALTKDAFIGLKADIDRSLSERLGLETQRLMPWHYQNRFFQEAPNLYPVDFDAFYRDKDVVVLCRNFYAGIGLPIDDLLAGSDLYEKEGKYQHACCSDIDREGDVRVVCNVKPNHSWMNTMLHEFGHAVYDKFNDRRVPWLLREPAHTFTTEAIAMLFGRFASHPAWLRDIAGIPGATVDAIAQDSSRTLRLEQMVFSRWAQVMYRFEKAMYENPDQDLNSLWWELVERYQMIRRPPGRDEPDWASKIHVALYPAYYHNYLMGELLASQLYYHIGGQVLGAEDIAAQAFTNNPAVGRYLIENIFKPGNTRVWNEMIEHATGEMLTARYYARQFVHEPGF